MEELLNTLSHIILFFAFPRLKSWRLRISLLLLILFSGMYHFSLYRGWGGPWRDLDHMSVLLFLVVALEEIEPKWGIPLGFLLALLLVFLSVFSNILAFVLALIIFYRPLFWWEHQIPLGIFLVGTIFFFIDLPWFHLIWHLCVFLAIYIVAPDLVGPYTSDTSVSTSSSPVCTPDEKDIRI